jgi:hypothetical protein
MTLEARHLWERPVIDQMTGSPQGGSSGEGSRYFPPIVHLAVWNQWGTFAPKCGSVTTSAAARRTSGIRLAREGVASQLLCR